jgi:uncharacterized protein DUF4154
MRRAGILIAMMLTLLTPRSEVRAQKSADTSEDFVKAGLYYNFAIYVTWPASAFSSADAPITYCVLGDESFAQRLSTDWVTTKKIGTRKLAVKKMKWSRDLRDFKDCTLLYISSSESAHGDDVIQMLKGAPILTVADFPDFTKHGGMINFFIEDSKVRFEVNAEAARQSDLAISSQVLIRAKIVPTGLGWR